MQTTTAETWREKVIEDHRELNEAVAEIRRLLQGPRPEIGQPGAHAWANEMSHRMVEFHDLLCRHFRYEEESGMMDELMENHPRATGRVEVLLDEHARMLEESRWMIGALLSYSEEAERAGAGLRRRLGAMLDQLEEHERHENSLIMDLAYSDLGLGD